MLEWTRQKRPLSLARRISVLSFSIALDASCWRVSVRASESGSEGLGVSVEDAVDERAGLRRREPVGEVDGLVYDNCLGNVGVHHFPHAQAQHHALDRAKTVERPVVEKPGDYPVDLVDRAKDAANPLLRKPAQPCGNHLGRSVGLLEFAKLAPAFGDEGVDVGWRVLVSREKQLHGPLAGLSAGNRHFCLRRPPYFFASTLVSASAGAAGLASAFAAAFATGLASTFTGLEIASRPSGW